MLYITSNPKSKFFLYFDFENFVLEAQLISNLTLLNFDRGNHSVGEILEDCGISEDRSSTVNFSLSTCHDEPKGNIALFSNDVNLSVSQTTKGRSVFLASLYSVVSHIELHKIFIN